MPNPAVNISFDDKGTFDQVAHKLKSVDISRASQEGIEVYGFTVERYAKLEAPVDTGRLRSSISTDIGNFRARVAPHVDYAIYVHEGTKFARAVPFMAVGLAQATARLFSGKGPFVASIQKELDNKLR